MLFFVRRGRDRETGIADRIGPAISGFIGFTIALAAAAAHGHLDDSPEFVLQTLELPYTPAALFARLCVLVPLGPIALRISFASALCLAAVGVTLHRAITCLLRAQGVTHARLRMLLALSLCAWAYAAEVVLFQGVRPGAHAFTSALALWLCSWLARGLLEPTTETAASRSLLALGFGLLFAQDLVLFCALLPVLALGIANSTRAVDRERGTRGAASSHRALAAERGSGSSQRTIAAARGSDGAVGSALTFGLAASPRVLGWGEHGFGGLPEPSSGAALLLQLLASHPVLFGAALLGAIALAQHERLQPAARLWCAAAGGTGLAGLLGGGDAAAASGGAALALAVAAASVLKAGLCGALLVPDNRPRASAAPLQLTAASLLGAAGLFSLQLTATRVDLSGFALGETLAAQRSEALPPRALVLHGDARDFANARAHAAEAASRPDLLSLSRADLERPESARALARRPELRGLVRSHLLKDGLLRSELASLGAERPVLVDAGAARDPGLSGTLLPSHLMFELPGGRIDRAQERDARAAQSRELEVLQNHAGDSDHSDTALRDRAGMELLARLQLLAAPAASCPQPGLICR